MSKKDKVKVEEASSWEAPIIDWSSPEMDWDVLTIGWSKYLIWEEERLKNINYE